MELLVVVSIIALLIAILLPSLRKAREQAKLVACLANLTGICKASLTYAADDPGENMIPVPDTTVLADASGNLEWGGKSGIGQVKEYPNTTPTRSYFGTFNYRGPAHRPLNGRLFKGGFVDYNPPNGMMNPGPERQQLSGGHKGGRIDLSLSIRHRLRRRRIPIHRRAASA